MTSGSQNISGKHFLHNSADTIKNTDTSIKNVQNGIYVMIFTLFFHCSFALAI